MPSTNADFAEEQRSSLISHAARGDLVVVIGTGVSISLTNGGVPELSWRGLIQSGFVYALQKGRITAIQEQSWKHQIASKDIDDLLSAAEFVGRKLGAPDGDLYARWLERAFQNARPVNKVIEDAIRGIYQTGTLICTLNYDTLLEQITGLNAFHMDETVKVANWLRREAAGILHLHGVWTVPESCVLGIRDYETTLRNDVRDLIQRSLASTKRLLFIGCGDTFSDPNFSALIGWLRRNLKNASPQHFALVRSDELNARHADSAWHGFVEPISYGDTHGDLGPWLEDFFAQLKRGRITASRRKKPVLTSVKPDSAELLSQYRAFLLKDCGQMTIEGVRADMDTAQRRFDLERLFVPLKLMPIPPDVPAHDPDRDEKLRRWKARNNQPKKFGEIFAKTRRLALLALPGGGKTMLLKRLAVAYADPSRRLSTGDALPELDLTPVLIRCREWREHIHRPMLTLLRSLPEITGHASLEGLVDALLPLFQKGNILLLVDGLDEIHDDALRSTFVEHLETFLDEYKRTRLVVTSREAGFDLVAPVVARFCQRLRVAPLEEDAIKKLCDHWHRLMSGVTPEAQAESEEVAEHLLRNPSLRRLAENPLLLTMLLVVKHGAGRLPPDRVSLYSRAVEVLLDTWNIKGHAPLNAKEAVPQLAFVAFEMMRAGKQTATEKELLTFLERAREHVPEIRRYASDSPHAFLKRVELRSSLLIEAGHQVEGKDTVPFYQFRHLTFQEYLAGVAVTEGHYAGYRKSDTVLTPLARYVTAEEWKEVIPMAAVLARKRAEPLITALITRGSKLRRNLEDRYIRDRQRGYVRKLPPPVARLIQCFVEEAEASPETVSAGLQLIAFFRHAGVSEDELTILARGPYGKELAHQAWLMYSSMTWPEQTWMLGTCLDIAKRRNSREFWVSNLGESELQRELTSPDPEVLTWGLFTYAGLYFGSSPNSWKNASMFQALVETHLCHQDISAAAAAGWGWGLARYNGQVLSPVTPESLDCLTNLFFRSSRRSVRQAAGLALLSSNHTRRGTWIPNLTNSQVEALRQSLHDPVDPPDYSRIASFFIAYHAGSIVAEKELMNRFSKLWKNFSGRDRKGEEFMAGMLEEFGSKVEFTR